MDEKRFGANKYRPEGQWVQNTPLLEVAGIRHHKSAALAFANAVESAERAKRQYGLRLEPEPHNPRDHNAIRVLGHAYVKPLFGPSREQTWHVGYVDHQTAAELGEDLISINHPYAAELSFIYRRGSFLALAYHVIVPKGSPATLRTHKRHAAAALDAANPLTPAQQQLLKQLQLGLYRNTRLEQAEALKKLGHFEEALDLYLRVAWLDQQGPANVGLMNGAPMDGYPPFQKEYVFIAPGIIGAIAAAANTLKVASDTLRTRFIQCGDQEARAIAPLRTIASHDNAWREIEARVQEALADGGHWRWPKSKP